MSALLSLLMVVRNDARTVAASIASAKPFVDRYAIVDSGAKDGTPELAKNALDGKEGEVVAAEFTDFAAVKNKALEIIGEAKFALVLEPDETLVGGPALREFLEQHGESTGAAHGAYLVRVKTDAGIETDQTRVLRVGVGYRFVGAAHETALKEKTAPPSLRIPGVHIEVATKDPKNVRSRAQVESRLLTEEAKNKPNDARVAFHLGQSLEALGEHRKAFEAYQRRVKMGGWQEEVFESLMGQARVSQAAQRPWPEVQQLFLDAYAHSQHRAEPLFAIAWHYYQRKTHALTYLFASRGATIPFPEKAALAVDAEVYRTKLLDLIGTAAYYVGELEAGEAALRKALVSKPGDARFLKNLGFYEKKKTEVKGERGGRNDGPKNEGSKSDAPKAEEPKSDAPKAEEPKAEEPKAETTPAEPAKPENTDAPLAADAVVVPKGLVFQKTDPFFISERRFDAG